MRDVTWRAGLTIVALMVLATAGSNLPCGVGHCLPEQALGQSPNAHSGHHLDAMANGDGRGALAARSMLDSPAEALRARRTADPGSLWVYGPHLTYTIQYYQVDSSRVGQSEPQPSRCHPSRLRSAHRTPPVAGNMSLPTVHQSCMHRARIPVWSR